MTYLDALYVPLAVVTAPWWALKKRSGWSEKLGSVILPAKPAGKKRVLLHAVSVGEVSALRSLVPLLTPYVDVVISVTTDTGTARAKDLFGKTCAIVRYPLDFSWAVRKFLDAVQPDAVALVELEVWPQFVRACAQRSIPACVINGRLSARSFKGYSRLSGFFGTLLNQLAFVAAQDREYAKRFEALGLAADKCLLTGTMKWDAANLTSAVAGADELAKELGIDRSKPLIVAGSTAEDEEALLASSLPDGVQLICAPRKPEHFDDAAKALPGCVRRSEKKVAPAGTRYFLLDTIGELRKAYALADLVVMGRSFGTLYGSDPIEPIALGKPTLIGPRFSDFDSIVNTLSSAGGLEVIDRAKLAQRLKDLLGDKTEREQLSSAGLRAIKAQQGASERHAELLLSLSKANSKSLYFDRYISASSPAVPVVGRISIGKQRKPVQPQL
ncbi:MAG: glycosyltransferase N-terminal domain-containing protein [Phycisphaerales bacterium]